MVEGKEVMVHQFVAVANGADPYKVFGDDDYSVDHKNGCTIDNRPENLQVLHVDEHGQKAGTRRANMGYTHKELLYILYYLTPIFGPPKINELTQQP